MTYHTGILAFFLSISFFSSASLAKNKDELLLGIFPHLPGHRLFEMYRPVANNLEKELGASIKIKTSRSFEDFEIALKKERFDIAVIQPFDYPDAHDNHSYMPLVTRASSLSSIIIVDVNSNNNSLKKLIDKTIAFPSKSAAVTRLAEKMLLEQLGEESNQIHRLYKSNQFSCIESVLIKQADACATIGLALNNYANKKMVSRFKIIAESEEIPHILLVGHKRIPKSQRDKIKSTILNWKKSEEGRKILKNIRMFKAKEAFDKDYDVIRSFKY